MERHAVLFVDDDKAILDAAQRLLHKSPFEIHIAASACCALEILENRNIEVVVSDESMPGMSGVEFLKTIRNQWPQIIRIMLTGKDPSEIAKAAIDSGAVFRLITKPWKSSEIGKLLERAILERELVHRSESLESQHPPIFTLNVIDQLKAKLVEEGLLSQRELTLALSIAESHQKGLGHLLVQMNLLEEEQLLNFISRQIDIPRANLNSEALEPSVVSLMPKKLAKRYRMIPMRWEGERIAVALVDPIDLIIADDIRAFLGKAIKLYLCSEIDLLQAIDRYYISADAILDKPSSNLGQLERVDAEPVIEPAEENGRVDSTGDEQVTVLVDTIIEQAVKEGASDIHFNPEKEKVRVRYRIDGLLCERRSLSKKWCEGVVSRLKIMSSLDISIRWVPQDGRIRVNVQGRDIELRVSTYPTIEGESVVLRVLDLTRSIVKIEELGFSERDEKCFNRIIQKSDGLFLVCGPTGSGKTTTLYSGIATLDSLSRNIITIEQPVEYQFFNVNQGEIHEKKGFGFANALRAILRHDPDVILVGEIRDSETAQVAFQAAMTGHLVLSTLHTKSAIGAVTRLKDLGIEPFIIGSSLAGVISQRLVRKICENCKEESTPSDEILSALGITMDEGHPLFKGCGCARCNGSGYKGRIGLFELFAVDQEISNLISGRFSEKEIYDVAIKRGMRSILQDGLSKVQAGITSLEEVFRVV